MHTLTGLRNVIQWHSSHYPQTSCRNTEHGQVQVLYARTTCRFPMTRMKSRQHLTSFASASFETAASRLFSYWEAYSGCIPVQVQGPTPQVSSDKHVGFGKETKGCSWFFFSTWSMHLPHLTTLRIYGLE